MFFICSLSCLLTSRGPKLWPSSVQLARLHTDPGQIWQCPLSTHLSVGAWYNDSAWELKSSLRAISEKLYRIILISIEFYQVNPIANVKSVWIKSWAAQCLNYLFGGIWPCCKYVVGYPGSHAYTFMAQCTLDWCQIGRNHLRHRYLPFDVIFYNYLVLFFSKAPVKIWCYVNTVLNVDILI